MSNIYRKLTVHPAIRGTVLSTETAAVTLPADTEYFILSEEGGAGAIRWGITQAAAESADEYHEVAASSSSNIIAANPLTVYVHAEGGDVDYYFFIVRAGD